MAQRAPGVFVEEVSTGTRPIAGVATSIAAFVGPAPDSTRHVNVAMAINNWLHFVREYVSDEGVSTPLARAVYGFFQNGGGRCYVVNVPANQPLAGVGRERKGLAVLEAVDDVAIVCAPGYADPASQEALIGHCEKMKDRVGVVDGPADVENIDALKEVATVGGGNQKSKAKALRPPNSAYAAFYFPHIRVLDPLTGEMLLTPPSGHIAGIYARTDSERGVHKAPANERVRGALGLAYEVTQEEQAGLNDAGVNCIRRFADSGIRVWGARTLDPGEWRYLPVRRTFNMIEESIGKGTQWVVFEPNTEISWNSVCRDCRAFLRRLWLDGALMGSTPEQAFFVKCDAETNPPEVIDAGEMVILIGIAPVKPAEFIIFRIGQWMGGFETDEGGGEGAGGGQGGGEAKSGEEAS